MGSSRNACGEQGSSTASVIESPEAKRVTSCPSSTSSSVSQDTTRSVPPHSLGGTLSANGANCAIRIDPPDATLVREPHSENPNVLAEFRNALLAMHMLAP